MTLEGGFAVAALGSTVLLALCAWLTRTGPVLITMGPVDEEERAPELRIAVAKALLRQSVVAFWLLIASGAAAAGVLFVAIIVVFVRQDSSSSASMIGVICGLGNSALFRYFFQVWRESRKVLEKLVRR